MSYRIGTKRKKKIRDRLLKLDDTCAYCGIKFDKENLPTIDHILAMKNEGNNNINNLILCCKKCNNKKGHKKIKRYKKGNSIFD